MQIENETLKPQILPTNREMIIRRVEIMCELFELAYEMKSLELIRRNPKSTQEWIHNETLRLIEAGTR